MRRSWYTGTGPCLRCGARLSGGRGRCRAWALKDKRRCKWHGGKSTGPRDWRASVAAMVASRKRMIERRHAMGFKAPGGRPPRVPDWLRCAVVREVEKELAGLHLGAILKWDLRLEGMSRAEGLARFDQFLIAELLDILRPAVGVKNRNRSAISLAWRAYQVSQFRIERGEKLRTRLDELLEDVATC